MKIHISLSRGADEELAGIDVKYAQAPSRVLQQSGTHPRPGQHEQKLSENMDHEIIGRTYSVDTHRQNVARAPRQLTISLFDPKAVPDMQRVFDPIREVMTDQQMAWASDIDLDRPLQTADRVVVEVAKNQWFIGALQDDLQIALDNGTWLSSYGQCERIASNYPKTVTCITYAAARVLVAMRRCDEKPERPLKDAVQKLMGGL